VTWFKVDDSLAFHAKAVAAGNAAMGLWVRAGSWCSQQLNDGFVPDHIVAALGTKGQADRLVKVRLWVRGERDGDSGCFFHQWNEEGRQPTRQKVEQDRAEAKERMRKNREARKSRSPEQTPNDARTSEPVRQPRPDPSRPVLPSTEVEGGSHVGSGPLDEPPRCPQHKGMARLDTPACWACKGLREQWEKTRTADVVFGRPAWCGDCDEFTRQTTRTVDGRDVVSQCKTCHPLAQEASA